MFYNKPLQPGQVSKAIETIYQDIQQTFAIDTIPVMFQYLANYEAYLFFIWEKMKINIESKEFHKLSLEIRSFAEKIVHEFHISSSLQDFANQLTEEEKEQITDTITFLERTNIYLMLLTLDIRESMKSVSIVTEQLTQYSSYNTFNELNPYQQSEGPKETKSLQLLTPLLGTNTSFVSQYTDFFSLVSSDMEQLKKTELYLQKRVELEHVGLKSITEFVEPLGCSYQEFRKLTENKTHVDELVYFITDLFPSQFPHLVLATALMQRVLQNTSNSPSVI